MGEQPVNRGETLHIMQTYSRRKDKAQQNVIDINTDYNPVKTNPTGKVTFTEQWYSKSNIVDTRQWFSVFHSSEAGSFWCSLKCMISKWGHNLKNVKWKNTEYDY